MIIMPRSSINSPRQVKSMHFVQPLLNFLHEGADAWVMLTAVGTIGLAIATFRVIQQNQQLRKDAERTRRDTERQHRDQFKPICALIPLNGIVPAERGKLLELIGKEITHQNHGFIHLRCSLRNTGSGPALNLRVSIRYIFDSGLSIPAIELSPLGAGEVRGQSFGAADLGCRLEWPVPLTDGGLNENTFLGLQKGGFEFILNYTDVFGQNFQSVHRVAPFVHDPAAPILWFTYHEGPLPCALNSQAPNEHNP